MGEWPLWFRIGYTIAFPKLNHFPQTEPHVPVSVFDQIFCITTFIHTIITNSDFGELHQLSYFSIYRYIKTKKRPFLDKNSNILHIIRNMSQFIIINCIDTFGTSPIPIWWMMTWANLFYLYGYWDIPIPIFIHFVRKTEGKNKKKFRTTRYYECIIQILMYFIIVNIA